MKKDILKKYKYTTKLGYKWLPDINTRYFEEIQDQMAQKINSSIRDILLGTPTGKYRKRRIKRYLEIPYPTIEWQYGDLEDAWRKEGILISLSWLKTPLVIGSKIVRLPILKKPTGTIKFTRYSKLKPVKIKHGKVKTTRRKEKRQKNLSTSR